MGPALGQADSFNSSGATIVPDHNESGSRHNTRSRLSAGQQVPSLVSQARMLMPEDTLGRELNDLVAMVNGGSGDDGFVDNQNWSLDVHQSEDSAPTASQPMRELSFSQFFPTPSSPAQPHEVFHSGMDHLAPQFGLHHSDDTHRAIVDGNPAEYRPSSAQSYTSNSEYSLSSTDIDNDSEMSDSNPQPQGRNEHLGVELGRLNMAAQDSNPGTSFWLHPSHLNNDIQSSRSHTIRPGALQNDRGISPSDLVSSREADSVGPIRGQSEDPVAKAQRVAHRRQINRKSAQKHRKMRKEEMEALTQQVVQRDREIAVLKRELAVEKAKVGQLAELMKNNGMTFGSQLPA